MSTEIIRPRLALLAPTDQHKFLCPPLEAAGFEVAACESRLDMLAKVLSISPAVIVVREDDQDGPSAQFYRSLARQRRRHHLAVLASLPAPDALQRSICLRRGVDAVIDDSMSTDEFQSTLKACLRRRTEILGIQAQRDQLASSLDLLHEGVLIIDEAGRVRHANTASLDLLDVDVDVLRQQSAARLLNVLGVPRETIDRVLQTEETLSERIQLHVADEQRDIEVSCVRIDDSGSGHPRWMVSLRDRSPEGEQQRLQTEFHSMVAHDLRSSLGLLGERVRVLQRLNRDQATQQIADEIRRQVEDLSAQLERRSLEVVEDEALGYGEMSLRQWLQSGIDEVASLARIRGYELSLDIDPELEGLAFRADRLRVTQALRDVLVHGLRGSEDAAQLRLRAAARGESLEILLVGVGIGARDANDPDLQPARQIFEAHGGGLDLQADEDQRNVVCMRLLLRADRASTSLD